MLRIVALSRSMTLSCTCIIIRLPVVVPGHHWRIQCLLIFAKKYITTMMVLWFAGCVSTDTSTHLCIEIHSTTNQRPPEPGIYIYIYIYRCKQFIIQQPSLRTMTSILFQICRDSVTVISQTNGRMNLTTLLDVRQSLLYHDDELSLLLYVLYCNFVFLQY